jgi:hypothetical protein
MKTAGNRKPGGLELSQRRPLAADHIEISARVVER